VVLSYRGLGLAALVSLALAGCAGATANTDETAMTSETTKVKVYKVVNLDEAGNKTVKLNIKTSDGSDPIIVQSQEDLEAPEVQKILAELKEKGIVINLDADDQIQIAGIAELGEHGDHAKMLKMLEGEDGQWITDSGDIHIIKKHAAPNADGKHVMILEKGEMMHAAPGADGKHVMILKKGDMEHVAPDADGHHVIIKKHAAPEDGTEMDVTVEKKIIIIKSGDGELDEEVMKLLEEMEIEIELHEEHSTEAPEVD